MDFFAKTGYNDGDENVRMIEQYAFSQLETHVSIFDTQGCINLRRHLGWRQVCAHSDIDPQHVRL